ncbi:MAG: hypothetical protein AB1657_03750 [Candidatus Micrarchaeota archaeon]
MADCTSGAKIPGKNAGAEARTRGGPDTTSVSPSEKKAASFWGKALIVAGLALVPAAKAACMGETSRLMADEDADADPVADAEAQEEDGASDSADTEREDAGTEAPDAEAEAENDSDVVGPETDGEREDGGAPDSDVGPEADAGPEAVEEADAETPGEDAGDAEAEAACPEHTTVSEDIPAPGPIGEIGQAITETYELTRECDGTETRGALLELDIGLAAPASPEQLANAIRQGSDTVIFGERVRLTAAGLGGIEYARKVPGAEGRFRAEERISDGVHDAFPHDFMAGSVIMNVAGSFIEVPEGGYAAFPDGNVVHMTSLAFDPMDPLGSTCYLTILEAPVNVPDGGTVAHDGGTFRLGTVASGADLAAARFRRE